MDQYFSKRFLITCSIYLSIYIYINKVKLGMVEFKLSPHKVQVPLVSLANPSGFFMVSTPCESSLCQTSFLSFGFSLYGFLFLRGFSFYRPMPPSCEMGNVIYGNCSWISLQCFINLPSLLL